MKYTTINLLRRVSIYAKDYWQHIVGIFLLNLLATPIALLKPLALKIVIDNGFGSQPLPAFIQMFFPLNYSFTFEVIVLIAVALVLVVALIDNINGVAMWLLETYTGEKMVLNLRTLLFNHIQRLSLAYHDRKGVSYSLYRMQWDTMSIRGLLIDNLSPIVSSFMTLISMIIIMFYINWSLALTALCVIPPLYILIRLSTSRLKKDWDTVKDDESQAMSLVHEVLGALRIVKAFGQEKNEQDKFITQSHKVIKGHVKLAWIGAGFNFLVGILFAIGTALFIYLGAKYVKAGQMSLGELTLVIAYLAQIFGPLQSISKNINDLQASIAGTERVLTVLDQEKEVVENPNAVHLNNSAGNFTFQNVSFSYQAEKAVLKDISFEIKSADRVGIIGTTGAGKSTLVSLLMRFYDATGGRILIDGSDIKNFKLADYRNQFSIVLQEPVLFSSTIAENIAYGRPGASESDIIDAAKAANAHDFILKCKDGYNSLVGERGMQLSGGERQRISLARAFIKNSPILILDEPTSAVDINTESLIIEAMERLMSGKTTFMITHRKDTLRNCNVIIKLENGELAEFTRHDNTNAAVL